MGSAGGLLFKNAASYQIPHHGQDRGIGQRASTRNEVVSHQCVVHSEDGGWAMRPEVVQNPDLQRTDDFHEERRICRH